MLCLDPVHSNSVLSVFSLSLLADIHAATNIDDALLEPSGCRGDVFTAAMQVQLLVIGKRVKSDTAVASERISVGRLEPSHF